MPDIQISDKQDSISFLPASLSELQTGPGPSALQADNSVGTEHCQRDGESKGLEKYEAGLHVQLHSLCTAQRHYKKGALFTLQTSWNYVFILIISQQRNIFVLIKIFI